MTLAGPSRNHPFPFGNTLVNLRRLEIHWLWLGIGILGLPLLTCSRNPADALYQNYEAARLTGNTEKVLLLAEKMVKNFPADPRTPLVLLELGRITKFIIPDPGKAVEYFRRIVYSYPVGEYTCSALRELGDLYHYHYHDYDRALVHYQRLVDLFPEYPEIGEIRYRINDCYFRQGNFEQAQVELKTLIKQNPDSPLAVKAYFEIGKNFHLQGKLKAAIQSYQSFLRKFPESELVPEVKFSLASALEEDGKLNQALHLLSEIKDSYQNPKVIALTLERIKKRISRKR